MKKNKFIFIILMIILSISNLWTMSLRSFVALPIDKGGSVLRLQNIYENNSKKDTFIASYAYGIDSTQTILLGLPYQINPSIQNSQKNLSVLYRYMLMQNDRYEGTSRFALLGGAIIPTKQDRDYSAQAGFVYTYFYNKHELDIDYIYKKGFNKLGDSANYDISWQYRLMPFTRDDWGITQELNSVIEFNSRWIENKNTTYQMTIGLQWVHATWVAEGGWIKDLNNNKETRYIISTRFHF